ncbi:PRD domain-containing protein [Bacillus thuringiensis]|nr:PRD domain-containing protein [Bacillus thuringiensis]MED2760437.1 PRD domain-containing protein [Bacillus thuringiensis]MED2771743.1 PRD domain-containing protein [Bacillus thuringiensis]MED2778011.1 PRD domain-containing protein [Bacillus thuringiensis]MED2780030.1 PRD domain-containing protein [Bacillus thuringiensis]
MKNEFIIYPYLDKELIRQEQLLNILIKENRWYQLKEISLQLQWTIKTIRKDIISINDCLPDGWRIISSKGLGIQLIKPLDSSLSNVIYNIRSKTKALKIIECIFNNDEFNNLSISFLSKKLYYSHSAINIILSKLKIHLNSYQLILQKKNLCIKGLESTLRIYITRFYLDIYMQHWPFEMYCQKQISTYLTFFEKKISIKLLPSEKHRLSFLLATVLTRIKKRRFVEFIEKDYKLLRHTTFYEAVTYIVTQIEREHSITFTVSEKIFLTIQFIGAKYHNTDPYTSKRAIVTRIKQQKGYAYSKCFKFVSSLEKKLRLSLLDQDDFLLEVIHCFRRTLYTSKIYGLPISHDNITNTSLIKKQYPFIFDTVQFECSLLFKEYDNDIKMPEDEIVILTVFIESIRLLQNLNPIKIFIYITENPGVNTYIHSWLQKCFHKQIEIISYSKQNSLKYIEYNKLDLLITDTDISIFNIDNNIKILKINGLPTERDRQSIQDCINAIM